MCRLAGGAAVGVRVSVLPARPHREAGARLHGARGKASPSAVTSVQTDSPVSPPLGSESPAQAGPSPAAAAKAWGLPGTVGCSRLCPPSSPVAASLPPEQPRRGGLPVSWCVANPRAVSQQHRGARPPHLCPWQCEPGGEGRGGSLVCPGPRLGGSRILERSCVTPAALCGPVTALGRVREPGLSARACLPEATRGS